MPELPPPKAPPKVGDVCTIGDRQYVIREVCGGFKSAQRRAFVIRKEGGECSYRRIGKVYYIVDRLPPALPDWALK